MARFVRKMMEMRQDVEPLPWRFSCRTRAFLTTGVLGDLCHSERRFGESRQNHHSDRER